MTNGVSRKDLVSDGEGRAFSITDVAVVEAKMSIRCEEGGQIVMAWGKETKLPVGYGGNEIIQAVELKSEWQPNFRQLRHVPE